MSRAFLWKKFAPEGPEWEVRMSRAGAMERTTKLSILDALLVHATDLYWRKRPDPREAEIVELP